MARRLSSPFYIPLVAMATFAVVYMVMPSSRAAAPAATRRLVPLYFPSCDAARAAGAAPIHAGQPGYRRPLDRDGDGIACEPYRGL
jgi:hypothetical protein